MTVFRLKLSAQREYRPTVTRELRVFRNNSRERDRWNRVGVAAFSIMRGRYLTDMRNAISGAAPQRASCVITHRQDQFSECARVLGATSTRGITNSSRFMHALNNAPDTCTERAQAAYRF